MVSIFLTELHFAGGKTSGNPRRDPQTCKKTSGFGLKPGVWPSRKQSKNNKSRRGVSMYALEKKMTTMD